MLYVHVYLKYYVLVRESLRLYNPVDVKDFMGESLCEIKLG